MAQNYVKFDEFLNSENMVLEKNVGEVGVAYVVRENIPGLGLALVSILFNDDDRLVTVISYQYLKVSDLPTREGILSLINTINHEYTMVKFTVAAGFLTAQIALQFKDNFNPEVVIEMVSMLMLAMQEEQPRFMASPVEYAGAV